MNLSIVSKIIDLESPRNGIKTQAVQQHLFLFYWGLEINFTGS